MLADRGSIDQTQISGTPEVPRGSQFYEASLDCNLHRRMDYSTQWPGGDNCAVNTEVFARSVPSDSSVRPGAPKVSGVGRAVRSSALSVHCQLKTPGACCKTITWSLRWCAVRLTLHPRARCTPSPPSPREYLSQWLPPHVLTVHIFNPLLAYLRNCAISGPAFHQLKLHCT